MKQKILKMKAKYIENVQMWEEGQSMISIYSRIGNTNQFQLSFKDNKDIVCPICGMYLRDESEKENHSECYTPELVSENDLIEIIDEVFNEIDVDDDNNIKRNIIQINGEKFVKRIDPEKLKK